MKIMLSGKCSGVTPGLHYQELINIILLEFNIMEQFEISRDSGPALALYKTEGGKFICERIDRTRWQGERDSHAAKVCTSDAEVFDFFGHSWLAKDLYSEAGLDAAERID